MVHFENVLFPFMELVVRQIVRHVHKQKKAADKSQRKAEHINDGIGFMLS
jgi:hypothetical protein